MRMGRWTTRRDTFSSMPIWIGCGRSGCAASRSPCRRSSPGGRGRTTSCISRPVSTNISAGGYGIRSSGEFTRRRRSDLFEFGAVGWVLRPLADAAQGGADGLLPGMQKMHGVENHGDDFVVPDHGIDHHVVEASGGPVRVEVMLDEGDALAIDGIDQILGIGLGFAKFHLAADFFRIGGVEKDVKSVAAGAQEIGSAAPD